MSETVNDDFELGIGCCAMRGGAQFVAGRGVGLAAHSGRASGRE